MTAPDPQAVLHTALTAACHTPDEARRMINALVDAVREDEHQQQLAAPILRHCLHPGCLREFDMNATMTGTPTRPSWSAKGWKQVRPTVAGGYICPTHAPLMNTHHPRWGERVVNALVLCCACGWRSPTASWQGYAVAAWQDHLSQQETP